jgi:hypothetical protein
VIAARAAARRAAAPLLLVGISLLVATGCMSDQLYTTKEIPKDQAAQQLNATFIRTQIPQSFTPLAATVSTTTWGSEARTVKAAFTTDRHTFDQFMTTVRTEGQPTWSIGASDTCPPSNAGPRPPAVAGPPDHLLNDWYDRGIFQRCRAIESWTIATTEYRDTARSTGGIYVQAASPSTDSDQVTTLIVSTIA